MKEFKNREFKIDTIKIIDEKKKLDIFLTIPISEIPNLDSIVREDILNDKDEFENEINERLAESNGEMSTIGNDYSCVLESIFEDRKFISYNFVNSQYYGGSAHGLSRFKSYNYHIKSGKFVDFSEYFSFTTQKDTILFLDLLTKKIDRSGIEVSTLEKINFNQTRDSITFNFDDYQIASYSEGLIQVKISKKEIVRWIRNNYR